ncbi:hypothetical protein OEZ86_012689 [Tetradesmus obliquus]|nr:hypothetical protein OEZ86_012689 [Tetradesmus obliquus]
MGTPVLYTYPLAYNPFKAALVLAEKNISYTSKYVDLFNGQSLSPEYLAVNPAGTVPALKDGDKTIEDSKAIVDYVNSLGDGPLGGSQVDQGLASRWADRIHKWDGNLFLAANGDPGAAKLLGKLTDFKMKYAEARAAQHPELKDTYSSKIQSMKAADATAKDAAAVAANNALLLGLLDDAEQQLASSSFLAGPAYSVADVMFTPVLFRLGMANKTGEYLKPRPHVSEYYNRMKERPSFKAAFGAASSKLTLASAIVPALLKAQLAWLTGWY